MGKKYHSSQVLRNLVLFGIIFYYIYSTFKLDISVKVKKFNYNLRAVCIILTQINNHKSNARAISDTWGRRCKFLIYITNSTIHLDDQKVFNMNRRDSYQTIWGKVKQALKHAYKKYKNEVDWFIKADDDSYVIMENIQSFIEEKKIKPSDPTWFGCEYRFFSKHGYMAGGGYVMSREAVSRFVKIGLNRTSESECKARNDLGAEDAEMGVCMNFVGVVPTDSRDEYGRGRIFPFDASYVVNPGFPTHKFWFWNYIKYPHVMGHPGCCSEVSMIFHYVNPKNMYAYEYLIYNAKIAGEMPGKRAPPPYKSLVLNMNINWTEMRVEP